MIPKELRVTFRAQSSYENGEIIPEPRLGFAQAYEPHLKSFAKKQATQDDWAYGGGKGIVVTPGWAVIGHEYRDGVVFVKERRWERTIDVLQEQITQIPDDLQPCIIKNVPMEGFRVQKFVSRYSTSNKLWRILDPRGFELEISTGCFENLILDGVIDHGVIMTPCVWGSGKTLIHSL
jgi:hypothetical protein